MPDDFQKATMSELKDRFSKLEERNEQLDDLIELDQKEITALKQGLRDAVEVVRACANTPLGYREDEVMMSYFYQCVFCEADAKNKTSIKHDETCIVLQAAALLSVLEKLAGKVNNG